MRSDFIIDAVSQKFQVYITVYAEKQACIADIRRILNGGTENTICLDHLKLKKEEIKRIRFSILHTREGFEPSSKEIEDQWPKLEDFYRRMGIWEFFQIPEDQLQNREIVIDFQKSPIFKNYGQYCFFYSLLRYNWENHSVRDLLLHFDKEFSFSPRTTFYLAHFFRTRRFNEKNGWEYSALTQDFMKADARNPGHMCGTISSRMMVDMLGGNWTYMDWESRWFSGLQSSYILTIEPSVNTKVSRVKQTLLNKGVENFETETYVSRNTVERMGEILDQVCKRYQHEVQSVGEVPA